MEPWQMIVLLGLVIVVFAGVIPRSAAKKGGQAPSAQLVKELEESMAHFASDLEQQNQALIDLFKETQREHKLEVAKLTARLEVLERRSADGNGAAVHGGRESESELSRHGSRSTEPRVYGEPAVQTHGSALSTPRPSQTEEFPAEAAAASVQPPQEAPRTEPDLSVRARYAALFELHDQGRSTEQIAKQLGMNKGEVMLIMQLAKREGHSDESK
ncbi:hypothetical protein PC41400_21290 [Paenibacillus chitinolyticus]|uniref:Uncharacterized protein n=1 Tax=Paenibacillus chitinolyticus TaxID=79263 RepID=A0A410X046_9BACL|nr:hypothetical protein [Paenibacillus chitinolyticus]MCY9592933.1 hypothetical protein [Paenibacillus chitinolyticus]MCY9595874.1 hypothetical protein [Paenibacillus chitinolyticus]QAV20059.1 hypothetical protein PC41400_21290 [Paenibacillus chitinolyticus]